MTHAAEGHAAPYRHAIKETVTAVVIAFVMAFVFRGFVVEAFLIPTGSMAPTLRGAHMQFRSPQTGYEWAVSPRDMRDDGISPQPVQAAQYYDPADPTVPLGSFPPIDVRDPMSGWPMHEVNVPTHWGDRIFVMKYLYSVFDPGRFDVVVFKNPRDPAVNYIKRLLGQPGEMLAIIDGDVFVRTPTAGDASEPNPWKLPGWSICRKPERAQRAMWQLLFDSQWEPLTPTMGLETWFKPPWIPVGVGESGGDWKVEGRTEYEYLGQGPTQLQWDTARRPIDDTYAYNDNGSASFHVFPVSDLRMSLSIRPRTAGQKVSAVVTARGHEFRARLGDGAPVIESRRPTQDGRGWEPWAQVAHGARPVNMEAGKVTTLDFWHVDQSLQLWDGDELLCRYDYDWTPAERVKFAMNMTLDEAARGSETMTVAENYTRPKARFEFEGGAFSLYRVALSRDVHYQADTYRVGDATEPHSRARQPALATHPSSTLTLGPYQYFTCGDNSPQSLDGRLWDKPHPWVAKLDPTTGVVNRDLLIGKAFFVYFPAPIKQGRMPVPDVGQMRWIW